MNAQTQNMKQLVKIAFFATHGGRSPDDVIIDDELNRAFLEKCLAELKSGTPFQFNWTLYNLRKSKHLGPVCTVRQRTTYGDSIYAAEIAARLVENQEEQSIDRVLCNPELRREFDTAAQAIAPHVSKYILRKAALSLRKNRRLRPELIARVADWGRTISIHAATELSSDLTQIPQLPGIYVFCDSSGYLYVGEAANLRTRVSKHLNHSDRKALARYFWEQRIEEVRVELHAFRSDSGGRLTRSRRAYEAELIQSRNPRFNIQMR